MGAYWPISTSIEAIRLDLNCPLYRSFYFTLFYALYFNLYCTSPLMQQVNRLSHVSGGSATNGQAFHPVWRFGNQHMNKE